jgi:hypothetical protein
MLSDRGKRPWLERCINGTERTTFNLFMKILKTALTLALMAPSPMLAATSADIKATGSLATFCNITNQGGPIAMTATAEGDKLSGTGSYSYIANGNSKVELSALTVAAPNGAAASIPSIELAELVSNNSSSAAAASPQSGGVIRKEGSIASSITQNNSMRLLTAGDYEIAATATCTSL